VLASRLSRLSPTSFLGALLRLPLRVIPKSAVVGVRSGINEGLRWVVGSSIHGCWLGHYEIEKQAVVRRLVKPGMKVFDIGANAGFYTLAFARLVGERGHVWAFEPLAENVQNLRRHVALNGFTNVTVVQAAVSERAGVARFATAESNSMGRLAAGGNFEVPTVSLDEFCVQAGIDSPDLIKLDIEGGESLALKGAGRVIAQGKATILLALHGREQEKNCVSILRTARYLLQYLDGGPVHDEPLRSDELVAFPVADARAEVPPGTSSCAG
jgi:FkbM family methyltransferase